jgi:hypothetical protein
VNASVVPIRCGACALITHARALSPGSGVTTGAGGARRTDACDITGQRREVIAPASP